MNRKTNLKLGPFLLVILINPLLTLLATFWKTVIVSVAFYICWSLLGVGKNLFKFLPEYLHYIGLIKSMALFVSIKALHELVPSIVNINNTNEKKD